MSAAPKFEFCAATDGEPLSVSFGPRERDPSCTRLRTAGALVVTNLIRFEMFVPFSAAFVGYRMLLRSRVVAERLHEPMAPLS